MRRVHGVRPTTSRSWSAHLAVVALGLCALTGCAASSSGGSHATTSPPDLTSSSTAQPTASPSGSLPPEAAAAQGGKYYGVFLAVAVDARDGRLGDAQARAHKLGYEGGVADIGCTPGAREQLHLRPGAYTAFSVLFATKEQAAQFASAYGDGVVGTAYVTAGCLD